MVINSKKTLIYLVLASVFGIALLGCNKQDTTQKNVEEIELLNVSYDPTRELYQDYNLIFQKYWKDKTGQDISIKQSHGGSGKQALSVVDGIAADVVTLALAGDVDALNTQQKLINPQWRKTFANNSNPYVSTIVFLVRKDNPKNIKDWDDLVREDIKVITPNPKTSGGARWNFLAAWAYATQHNNGSEKAAQEFITKLYKNTPVLDTGARGAAISFTQRQLGDVLIAWENEAYLVLNSPQGKNFSLVVPSMSILCEPSVAIVDSVVDKKNTRKYATAYLEYLYSDEAQRLIGKNYYRPSNPKIFAEFKQQFTTIPLVSIDKDFGGWKKAQQKFFADNAVFDQIYNRK